MIPGTSTSSKHVFGPQHLCMINDRNTARSLNISKLGNSPSVKKMISREITYCQNGSPKSTISAKFECVDWLWKIENVRTRSKFSICLSVIEDLPFSLSHNGENHSTTHPILKPQMAARFAAWKIPSTLSRPCFSQKGLERHPKEGQQRRKSREKPDSSAFPVSVELGAGHENDSVVVISH